MTVSADNNKMTMCGCDTDSFFFICDYRRYVYNSIICIIDIIIEFRCEIV